jgi:PPOX class probable F420-dependent enzyme
MKSMTPEERDAFLAQTRLGILTTLRHDGWPVSVPIWFEWDGITVRVFTGVTSAKIKRLENDPRATLLATNTLNEPERWVAFDGRVEIRREGGFELAHRLAARYWNLDDPEHKATVEEWREAAPHLRVLELRPERIRTYAGD